MNSGAVSERGSWLARVAALRPGDGPWIRRDLGRKIAHPVRQTALTRRSRKAFLDRPDDPRRPVADHEQRIAQPSGAQVLEERPHRFGILNQERHLVAREIYKQRRLAALGDMVPRLTWPDSHLGLG